VTSPATTKAATARTSDLFAPGMRGLTMGLVATITLVALESLAIGTVMPIVARELGDLQLYGWVLSAFFLGNLLGIVVAGGALDRMPLGRPFAAGLGLFALGLLIGGMAPSMPVLVGARFIQGLGGGAVAPTAYLAIGRCLPERLQPRMFAILSTAWVVPGVIGPSIAAVVGQVLGWRWVFLGLLPLLAIAGGLALSALRHVPPARPVSDGESAAAAVRRLPNALLAAAGAGLLVAALTERELPLLVAGSALGLVLLVPAFRRLTPRGTLLLAAGVPAAVLLRGVLTLSFFAGDAYIALLLQTWRGTPATLTGLVFTSTTLTWSAGSWWQARRIERWGSRRFVALGFGLVGAGGLLTIPVVFAGVPPEITIATWAVTGLGMGVAYSALTLVILRRSAPGEQGAALSALQLSDILGTALGTGVGGAITAVGERGGGDGLGWGLGLALVVSVFVALAGLLASGRLPGRATRRSPRVAAVD
jgi:MFS family permease